MAQPVGSGGARAEFGPRLLAFIIDYLVVGIPFFILFSVLKTVGYGLGMILIIGYYIYFEGGESGQTIGKKAMKIKVVDAQTGGPLGYGKAALRYIGRIPSSICFIGYLWSLWDPEKQTWHDKIATTYVVPA